MSMPAVEPHSRPAGKSPQFAVTIGAGFGRPSPVIGFPETVAVGAAESGAEQANSRTEKQANSAEIRIRDENMAFPLLSLLFGRFSQGYEILS
jgi:hypothetical protein